MGVAFNNTDLDNVQCQTNRRIGALFLTKLPLTLRVALEGHPRPKVQDELLPSPLHDGWPPGHAGEPGVQRGQRLRRGSEARLEPLVVELRPGPRPASPSAAQTDADARADQARAQPRPTPGSEVRLRPGELLCRAAEQYQAAASRAAAADDPGQEEAPL